ncbi:hypothetical protein L249_8529 [Ophiocordyceps polyrhachis-furcata BCC 54312]|uniref:Cytochrome b-c1 complex subunit 6, mitochondrial n=1 Tax=Ophiocordyceps polyrhachis-furcata BCC 54312 TaxID=1330021 RepID=A0A367L7C9_9HYPO|nr:hypothetical protein L249_8529 [Ophiocordyceps polyrhachis-furcata BCC 54312]
MTVWDAISDIIEAAKPWGVAEAEAPAEEPKAREPFSSFFAESSSEEKVKEERPIPEDVANAEAEEEDADKEAKEEEGGKEDEDEEEEEDEDEDEIVDPKDVLEEECRKSAQCAPAKHHYDDCVERVQKQESDGEAKEDCVEEFFHLAHCATTCAAPRLWSKLR